MSKDGSRFGRRSNWFKMKFRLADQPTMTDDQYSKISNGYDETSTRSKYIQQQQQQSFQHSGLSVNKNITGTEQHRTSLSSLPSLPFAFDQNHSVLANPFYPPAAAAAAAAATAQYPFHPTLLHRAIEDFSNFYRHQQNLLQQQQQHQPHHSIDSSINSSIDSEISEETDDGIEPLAEQTPSPISSSTSSSSLVNLHVSDDQEYPIDLSLKSRSPVDFSRFRSH